MKLKLIVIAVVLFFTLPLCGQYIFLTDGSIVQGTVEQHSSGYRINLADGAKRYVRRRDVLRIKKDASFQQKKFIYLSNDKLMGAYIVHRDMSRIIVRKDLTSSNEYTYSMDKVVGIFNKKICTGKDDVTYDDYYPIKNLYVLINPGGFLFNGFSLELGGQIAPDITLGFNLRYNLIGLYAYAERYIFHAIDVVVPWYDFSYGISLTFLPQFGTTRHKFFTGLNLNYRMKELTAHFSSSNLSNHSVGHVVELFLKIGYRFRLKSSIFFDVGAAFGPAFILNTTEYYFENSIYKNIPLMVRFSGNIILAVGYEFL